MDRFKLSSKFYAFSVILWDYLIGNALFVLSNICIPLFFFVFKVNSPLFLILALYVLSLNIIPSFIALVYLYLNKLNDHQSVMQLYLTGYKKSFKNSIGGSSVLMAVLFLFILDYQYFMQRGYILLSYVFAIGALIVLYFIMSYVVVQAQFNFNFKESILISVMYFKQMNRPVVTSLMFSLLFVYMIRAKVFLLGFIVFAFIAQILVKQSKGIRKHIYKTHTHEGIKEGDKNNDWNHHAQTQ